MKHKTLNKWQEDNIDTTEPALKKAKITKAKESKFKGKNAKRVASTLSVQSDTDHSPEKQFSDDNTDNDDIGYDIYNQQWSVLGVPTPIIKALRDQQFYSPTPIQALTLPSAILGHRDVLGAAETGSGKTLAFGIPIIAGILELKNRQVDDSNIRSMKETSIDIENKGWICTENKIETGNSSSESDNEEDIDDVNENGIGCVRVIDNIKVNEVGNYAKKPLFALILTPTRELAIQIKDHLTKAAKYTDIKVSILIQ